MRFASIAFVLTVLAAGSPLSAPADTLVPRSTLAVGATQHPAQPGPQAVTVRDWQHLSAAITAGADVFVPADAVIDVPNEPAALRLQPGQRLVGDRNLTASAGGALRIGTRAGANAYPVITMSSHSAIEGLQILGPNAGVDTENTTIGIQTVPGSTGVRVRGNELAGWSWAAVSIKQSINTVVEYNSIHDNVRTARGYGVVTQNGDATATIRNNVFNRNRHAIAGSGQPGEGYTAEHNLIRQDGGRAAYHQFDMHQSAAGIGGAYVHIRRNVFDYGRYGTANRSAINIRGIPTTGPATITGNVFTQGWTVGTQTAIAGVPGAIDTPTALQQENSFNQPITYTDTAEGCAATTSAVQMIGPCAALQ